MGYWYEKGDLIMNFYRGKCYRKGTEPHAYRVDILSRTRLASINEEIIFEKVCNETGNNIVEFREFFERVKGQNKWHYLKHENSEIKIENTESISFAIRDLRLKYNYTKLDYSEFIDDLARFFIRYNKEENQNEITISKREYDSLKKENSRMKRFIQMFRKEIIKI